MFDLEGNLSGLGGVHKYESNIKYSVHSAVGDT